MDCNIPVLQKFCFFFPLRPGLLVYGYFKLIVSIIIEIFFAYMLIREKIRATLIGLMIATTIVDAIATGIFLYGCHKKNLTCIKWFYQYSLCLLTVKALGLLILSLFHPIPWEILPNILLHIYLLLLIRSEIIKLKNQNETPCEFENKLANPNCTIKIVKLEVEEHPNPEKMENRNEATEQSNVITNGTYVQNEKENNGTTINPISLEK